jgi:hypothetical protein
MAAVVGSLAIPLSATAAIDEVNTTKLRQAID